MMFQGNFVDLIILFLLFIWMFDGWERGFFHLLADLFAFLGSFLFGLRFYSRVAFLFIEYFALSRGFANALGFFLVYSVAQTIFHLIFLQALKGVPLNLLPRFLRKFLGIFPALLNGLIVIAAIITIVVSLPIREDVKLAVVESQIGGYLVKRTSLIERSMDQIFGEAIQESLAFLTIKPESDERINLGFELEGSEYSVSLRLEKAMLALVNHERVMVKADELEWDPVLANVARLHAQDMFERGYFSHISPEGKDVGGRLGEGNARYSVAGENLAFAPSLEIAHDGLMQSEGHRENIVNNDFGRVGIGVVDGGKNGKMFVQVFSD